MCMALPDGQKSDTPVSRWRRLLQWLGFAGLLGWFLAVGLFQWVRMRWAVRDPNIG